MRRLIAFGLALALLATPLSLVSAQPALLGPGGIMNNAGASVTATNTAAATTMYSFVVPAGFAQANFGPLHLKLLGRVSSNPSAGAGGAYNIGCNYGGSTASIALVNGATMAAALTNAPLELDLWLTGYTARQANGITASLQGRLLYTNTASVAQTNVFAAQVDGTTALSTSNTLTCVWQWGSASATNSLVITSGSLGIGN